MFLKVNYEPLCVIKDIQTYCNLSMKYKKISKQIVRIFILEKFDRKVSGQLKFFRWLSPAWTPQEKYWKFRNILTGNFSAIIFWDTLAFMAKFRSNPINLVPGLLTYLNGGNTRKTRVLDTKRVLQSTHKVLIGDATQLRHLLRRLVTKYPPNIKPRTLHFIT